ncbi:MAG: type I methionyl aminopeptidase [Proteobacteria bacterium]|nr:type I methionyl aminopeptidase [Pseudomonadota bacterium]MBU1715743.1 type I methionyl aminopeptidase [Pseudomonadota bacterium]
MGTAIILKSPREIQIMLEANQIVADTLVMLQKNLTIGMTTMDLDAMAEEFARSRGGIPAFKGYRGFPGSLCVSINEQVVHGIPSSKVILRDGDIVSIDFGVNYKGYFGDSAITIPVGKVGNRVEELIRVTSQSLDKAIEQARVGNRINDISRAVQQHVEKNKFNVVRQFVGHGIGSQLHEPPEIPNYSRTGRTPRLLSGMVLAIEPMVNIGGYQVKVLKDGWTVVTADKSPSAHFEHSVLITDDEPVVLSRRK